MRRITRTADRRRTTQRLVRIALREWDTDRGWGAIAELQGRGSPQTLALARSLATSANWRRRALGLCIASQLRKRAGGERFGGVDYEVAATQELLLQGLRDVRVGVVRAAISGFGHRAHPAALPELVALVEHRDARLRWGLALALGGYDDERAIDALLRLAGDADAAVRDWATFGLGTLRDDRDTPEIRAVLRRNLGDADEDVRGEALVGLAQRGDAAALDHLLTHLDEECRVYELEAAEKLADPRLHAALLHIAERLGGDARSGHWYGHLIDAIEACARKDRSAPSAPTSR